MGWHEGPRTFIAGEALAKHRVVRPSATVTGEVTYVADGDVATYDGLLWRTLHAAASGDSVACVPLHDASRTHTVVASEAVAANAKLYLATTGRLSDTATGNPMAVSITAAGAANEQYEAVALPPHMLS